MQNQPGLPTPKVARIVGVPFRTLDYWVRSRLLVPTVPANGYGSRRLWTFRDILAARTVAELRKVGVPLQRIRRAVKELRRHGESLAGARLVSDGRNVFHVVTEDRLVELVQSAGQISIYPLHEWYASLRPQVEEAAEEVLEEFG